MAQYQAPPALTAVRTKDSRVLLVIIVKRFLDDIVPVAIRYIHKENISQLMRLYRILEFLWHLQLAKKPARIPMRGIAIHRVLIGYLIPGRSTVNFLKDQFPQAVQFRRRQR